MPLSLRADVRLRPEHGGARSEEGPARSGRLRSGQVQNCPGVGDLRGRDQGAHLARLARQVSAC